MLNGENIRLRLWRDDDLPSLTTLRNDVALQAQLLSRARGSRPEQVRDWLESWNGQTNRMFFIIAEREDDQACGYIQSSDLDAINGYAELGICLDGQARGRGLCGQAISLLANYLQDQWRVRKLGLKVRADNTSAIRCYERVGFERCGLLQQHIFIEGSWHDVVLMERFLATKE
jgi:RimJ/RimL family protein N-acetyltransferase